MSRWSGALGVLLILLTGSARADECDEPSSALPDDIRARFVSAESLLGEDDAESAADFVELMLVSHPRSVAVLELGVRVYTAMEDDDRTDELRRVLEELCPGHSFEARAAPADDGPLAAARQAYRDFLNGDGDRDRARRRAIREYEAHADGGGASATEAWHALAVLYRYDGRPALSLAALRQLARRQALQSSEVPDMLLLLRGEARTHRTARIWREASAVLSAVRASLDATDLASAERHLGFVALHLEQWDDAETAFEAAIEMAPADAEAHFGLATVYDALGQRAAAGGDVAGAKRYSRRALEHVKHAVSHPRYGTAARQLMSRLQFAE